MKISDLGTTSRAALRAEALDWLRRLHGGEASHADAEAVARWRARSPAHAEEFAEVQLFWSVLGDAARKAQSDLALSSPASRPGRHIGRRAFLAGGAALAASAAGAMVLRPPLGLWPSAVELAADYRTRTGERRQIEIENLAAVELNTRTSIDLPPPTEGGARIELIAGEAAIATRDGADLDLVVIAGNGRVASRAGSFNIRKDGPSVSVSCISGAVTVSCGDRTVALRDRQQVAYDAEGTQDVAAIDPEVITAWQRGLLMFRRALLSHVIEEVNRYRSGRVVLLDAALGRRQVVANFRLDRIEDVVDFISKAMGIPIRSLPGGVVLVG